MASIIYDIWSIGVPVPAWSLDGCMAKWSGVSILAVLKWIIAQEHSPELVPDKVTVAGLDKGSSSSKKKRELEVWKAYLS